MGGTLGPHPAELPAAYQSLPEDARELLLVAAAQPVGDVTLLLRALDTLGIAAESVVPAENAGLIEIGQRVGFPHPFVRSAAYRAATPEARRRGHAALADATDPDSEPDRRAWHRAHATAAPDETVAVELERCASRAQARAGPEAAAAFLERAVELTRKSSGAVSAQSPPRRPNSTPAR